MTNLVNALTAETADFKRSYMIKTQNFAEREFDRQSEIDKRTKEEWCKFFGIEPQIRTTATGSTYIDFPRNFYNTRLAKEHFNLVTKAAIVVRKGKAGYVIDCLNAAEKHYAQSIEKLAFRIQQKGLDEAKIRVSAGFLGHNYDCIITDGKKQVKASTIIAEGPIQRPHYRYLIK